MVKLKTSAIMMVAIFLLLPSCALAQSFPQDIGYSDYSQWSLDSGRMWSINSLFHPLEVPPCSLSVNTSATPLDTVWFYRCLTDYTTMAQQLKARSANGLAVLTQFGFETRGETGEGKDYDHIAIAPFLHVNARIYTNWFADFVFRATNESASLSHYTGIPRRISRAGFNTAEIDRAQIGFENHWAQVTYGRTREIWGVAVEDNLVLAGSTPAWEQLSIQAKYKRLKYRYFYGFLEAIDTNTPIIQRYIVGRGVEYSNHKNLTFGFTETAILAGANRSPDMAFLNPLAFEMEIEQNHRGNSNQNSSQANAVWTIHVDYLPHPNLRLSGSYLIDEFQMDQQDIDRGRTNLIGYLFHVAFTPIQHPAELTLFLDGVHIGTYTMMHSYKWIVFCNRNHFMGHSIGNDAERFSAGGRLTFSYPLSIALSSGVHRWGEMSLLDKPYAAYGEILKIPFPSGAVKRNVFIEALMTIQPTSRLTLELESHFDLHKSGENSAQQTLNFTVRYLVSKLADF